MRILEIGNYVFDADKLECITKIRKESSGINEYGFGFQVNGHLYNMNTMNEPIENITKIRKVLIETMKT